MRLGDWIDPVDVAFRWSCVLYDPEGERAGDGDAHTPQEAMALAWLCAWAPDALINHYVNHYVQPGSVPYDMPDGWRFELIPPWRSKKD